MFVVGRLGGKKQRVPCHFRFKQCMFLVVAYEPGLLEFDTEYKVKGAELGDVKIGVVPFRLGEGQMQTGVCVW